MVCKGIETASACAAVVPCFIAGASSGLLWKSVRSAWLISRNSSKRELTHSGRVAKLRVCTEAQYGGSCLDPMRRGGGSRIYVTRPHARTTEESMRNFSQQPPLCAEPPSLLSRCSAAKLDVSAIGGLKHVGPESQGHENLRAIGQSRNEILSADEA